MATRTSPAVHESGTESSWFRRLTVSLTVLIWVAMLFVAGWLLVHLVFPFLLVVVAMVVSVALAPLVDLLSRWVPRWIAIAVCFILGIAAIMALVFIVGYTATTEATRLVPALPGYLDEARRLEPRVIAILRPIGIGAPQLDEARALLLSEVRAAVANLVAGSVGVITGTLSAFITVLLGLMLSLYLTANGPTIRRQLLQAGIRLGHGERVAALVHTIGQVVGGYVRGVLAMATIVGVLVTGSLAVVGVPYALMLGVIVWFMQFVPIVGVMISGAICILVTLATAGWQKALLVWVIFIGIQVLDGDIIGPRVLGKAVGIHPATALVALVAGTELWGIWGALFAAPIAGLLQALILAVYRSAGAVQEVEE